MGRSEDLLPPVPYVPGRTPRPRAGFLDPIRATARPGMSPAQLAASAAWEAGRRFYALGYYWEAHEVLEPVWLALPPNSAERELVRAAIQLANARLKLAMGRPGAALRLAGIAARILAERARPEALAVLGLAPDWGRAEVAGIRAAANRLRGKEGGNNA